jgi:acetoacetate decarboxylase
MDAINSDVMEKRYGLTKKDVLERAFAMQPGLHARAGHFFDRPAPAVSYRTDLARICALVPESLVLKYPLVNLTFFCMVIATRC